MEDIVEKLAHSASSAPIAGIFQDFGYAFVAWAPAYAAIGMLSGLNRANPRCWIAQLVAKWLMAPPPGFCASEKPHIAG